MKSPSVVDKNVRIALLLREAGVFDDAHWQSFAKKVGLESEKGLSAILTQDLSLRSFRELLSVDLKTLKYLPKNSVAELEHALGAPVRIFPSEIAFILKRNQPDVARLSYVFLSRNVITNAVLEGALDKAEHNALNIYDVLVNEQLITPESIEQVVQSGGFDMGQDNRRLLAGDILIFNNLVTKEDYSRALENHQATQAPLSVALSQLKLLAQADLYSALEKGVELPAVELLTYDISQDLLDRFPEEFMRRQLFLPLSIQEKHFEIGTTDPFNLALADTISLLTGRRVSMIYSPHSDLLTKLDFLFPEQSEAKDRLTTMPLSSVQRTTRMPVAATPKQKPQFEAAVRVPDIDLSRRESSEPFVDNLSTVQLVTQVIESAIGSRSTDIHIEPQADGVRVRYRIDGVLHNIMRIPSEMQLSVISRIKVLAAMNVTERRRPQDGHFSFTTGTSAYDFRISTLPSYYGEKVVMRVLDSARVMTGLPQLGLENEQLKTVERLLARPYGCILVTGPTGSGKTSTLYACLSTVNKDGVNIITIEDPVEYQLSGITQVQVDENIDLSFAAGMRSALRQDPDIIMVGEVRDPDTAHTAIRAALTGHLVFSTLHTNSAIGAVSALAHMGIPQYLVASAVSGIVAQRLVRRICEQCKKATSPAKSILRELGVSENSRRRFFQGEGCESCFGTGFEGRTGIFEVIEVTETLRRAIIDRASEEEMAEIANKRGQPLFASGVQKALSGVTTPSEVLKAVSMQQ